MAAELEKEDILDSSSEDSDEDMEDQEEALRNIEILNKQLKENPQYYDGYLNLISELKKIGELEQLREARENMRKIYPLTPEIWLDWIKDEEKICTTDEERSYVIKLFEASVLDYTSVKLWLEYIMFMLGGGDTDATRAVCNKALVAVGTHVAEGILVWQAVLLFEQQVYATLVARSDDESETSAKLLKSQKQKIQNLYKRQFRVPLLNMEKEVLLQEAGVWFDGEIETHMKNDLDKALKKLQTKVAFEEKLLQVSIESEKLVTYRLYLEHLKNLKENPVDVQSLYERAITDNALDIGLWEEYIHYMLEKFGNSDYLILPICERSLRNCPWSGNLVDLYINALQQCQDSLEEDITPKIKDILDKALANGVPMGSEVTKMWMAYLVFLRRKVTDWQDASCQEIILFKESCQTAIKYIDQSHDQEGDLESTIPRFYAQILAEFLKDIKEARNIWNDIILQRNNNFNNAYMWIQFINLERSYGTQEYCRKLFRRALERVWDNIEIISEAFRRFEQETGTYETMAEFNKRLSERMVHVKKREEDLAKKENTQQKPLKSKFNKNDKFKDKKQQNNDKNTTQKWKNKPNRNDNETNGKKSVPPPPGSTETTKKVIAPPGFKSDVAPPPGFKSDVAPPPGFKSDVAPPPGLNSDVAPPPGFTDIAPPPGFTEQSPTKGTKRPSEDDSYGSPKKPKVNLNHGEKIAHDESDNPRTVFLSNLDYTTTEDQIREIVCKCGEIQSLRLTRDFKGRSKGFGYLVFVSQASAIEALKLDRTRIDGRPMFISACKTEKDRDKNFKFSTSIEKEKLFVRGIPNETTEDELKTLFSPHGEIKELRLVTYRNGFSKGNCYITYNDAETAESVRQIMDGTEINGKKISVFISDPSRSNAKLKGFNDPVNQPNIPLQTSAQKPKAKLAFIPRALQKKPAPPISKPATTDGAPKSNADFRNMFLNK